MKTYVEGTTYTGKFPKNCSCFFVLFCFFSTEECPPLDPLPTEGFTSLLPVPKSSPNLHYYALAIQMHMHCGCYVRNVQLDPMERRHWQLNSRAGEGSLPCCPKLIS